LILSQTRRRGDAALRLDERGAATREKAQFSNDCRLRRILHVSRMVALNEKNGETGRVPLNYGIGVRPTVRHPEGLPAKPISEYARHAPPGLDPFGRFLRNSIEQAVLDIPAFLGRKAN
jgi:hypothetical protein